MDVSIVILNYRSRELVKQCVKTILEYGMKSTCEIIVVDNDSHDGIGDMLAERFPGVKFIQSESNGGYAHGNNLGIKASSGKYVLVMNPDITVRPGSIDALVDYMEANPKVGVCGPKLVHPSGTLDASCYRFPTRAMPLYRRTPLGKLPAGKKAISHYLMDDYDRKEDREVDWLLGAVLMTRREAIDQIGLLDERYFLYLEDTDWCRRFWKAGWKVMFVAGTEMVHFHERLSARGPWIFGPFRKSTRVHIASWAKYEMKWRSMAG